MRKILPAITGKWSFVTNRLDVPATISSCSFAKKCVSWCQVDKRKAGHLSTKSRWVARCMCCFEVLASTYTTYLNPQSAGANRKHRPKNEMSSWKRILLLFFILLAGGLDTDALQATCCLPRGFATPRHLPTCQSRKAASSLRPQPIYQSTTQDHTEDGDPSLRGRLRKVTGFSLTALRTTLRAATGISLSALYASSVAVSGLWIRRTMSIVLSVFPTWVS